MYWNKWYHVTGSTYGTWLRGDSRGWRTRHHREHIEGDYRNPPPIGTFETMLARSRASMRRDPISLSLEVRPAACQAMVGALLFHKVELLALAVGARHYHLLARFPLPKTSGWNKRRDAQGALACIRYWMGIAKKTSARELMGRGYCEQGGIWAVRCRALSIRDRQHQLNTFRYILNHKSNGAATWSFRSLIESKAYE